MPTVIFNGETYEGEIGETIVKVGRRHEAHVGYLCGGIGICQTCVCKVTSGAEHLSPINDVERRFCAKSGWIPGTACLARHHCGGLARWKC